MCCFFCPCVPWSRRICLAVCACAFNCLQGRPCGRLIFTIHVCVCVRVFFYECQCCPAHRGALSLFLRPLVHSLQEALHRRRGPNQYSLCHCIQNLKQYPDVVGIKSYSFGCIYTLRCCRAVAPPKCGSFTFCSLHLSVGERNDTVTTVQSVVSVWSATLSCCFGSTPAHWACNETVTMRLKW